MKNPSWLTEAICKAYSEGATVEQLSQAFEAGRSVASIRSILVRRGVYVSKNSQAKQLRETRAEEHGF